MNNRWGWPGRVCVSGGLSWRWRRGGRQYLPGRQSPRTHSTSCNQCTATVSCGPAWPGLRSSPCTKDGLQRYKQRARVKRGDQRRGGRRRRTAGVSVPTQPAGAVSSAPHHQQVEPAADGAPAAAAAANNRRFARSIRPRRVPPCWFLEWLLVL